MTTYNVPIEPGHDLTGNNFNSKIVDLWGWLIRIIPKFGIIKTIDVKKNPIPLAKCCVMEEFNNMDLHNKKLIENTDGKFYIGEKDGRYYIFASD
jgi:hypothetical protein